MKHNLKDITFLLLVRIDTIERIENLLTTTKYLLSHFDTNINILEASSYDNGILRKLVDQNINYEFVEDEDPILFRTKHLNYMLRSAQTPFVSVWDVDVIASVGQILEAVNILREDKAQFVYPYTGKFLDTSFILRKIFLKNLQIDFLNKNANKMKPMYPPNPVGGAFLCNLNAYTDIGLENEDFYGWGVEDGDRYQRWDNSIYKLERVNGILFHLSHSRGINSVFHNKDQSFIKLRTLEASVRRARLSKQIK